MKVIYNFKIFIIFLAFKSDAVRMADEEDNDNMIMIMRRDLLE